MRTQPYQWQKHVFSTLGLVIGLVTITTFGLISLARAALSGPPSIDTSNVTIAAPTAGGTVSVIVPPAALGNADNDTDVWVVNITRSGSAPTQAYTSSQSMTFVVSGGSGDLLELRARNNADEAGALIAYVPDGTDIVRPDFNLALIAPPTSADSNGDYHIVGAPGAVLEAAFPVIVSAEGASPASVTLTGSGGTSSTSFDLVIPGSALGTKVRFTATDAYGNATVLQFRVGGGVPVRTIDWFPPGYASPYQGAAERTGVEARHGTVLLAGREFTMQLPIAPVSAKPELALIAHYRQGITYDGDVGPGWDLGEVASRVEVTDAGASLLWFDGTGRRQKFTNKTPVSGADPHDRYDSPPGVLLRMRHDVAAGEYSLVSPSGSRRVFDDVTGLVKRLQDGADVLAPESVVGIVRNQSGQPTEIHDAIGRRTLISWFYSGRIAEVTRPGGGSVQFEYDSLGRLIQFLREDGSAQQWTYDGSSSRITSVIDANGVVLLENGYAAGVLNWQQLFYQREAGVRSDFVVAASIDADLELEVRESGGGHIRRYGFEASRPSGEASFALEFVRDYSDATDRDGSNGYPGSTADPAHWEKRYEYDAQYLPTRSAAIASGGLEVGIVQTAYQANPTGDPRKFGRISTRTELGDGVSSVPRVSQWQYDSDAQWASRFVDPHGNVTSYEHDAEGRVTKSSKSITKTGSSTAPSYDIVELFEYDSQGMLVAHWSSNRVAAQGEASQPSTTFTYYTSGAQAGYLESEVRHSSTPSGASLTKSYTYDANGNIATRTDPVGAAWTFDYDARGRPTGARSSPIGRTFPGSSGVMHKETRMVYDGDRLVSEWKRNDPAEDSGSGPEWLKRDRFYTSNGLLDRVEEDLQSGPGGVERHVTEYEYDSRGRSVETRIAGPNETGQPSYVSRRALYDSRGLLLATVRDPDYGESVSDGDEVVDWFRYDHAGNVVESFSAANGRVEYEYNAFGDRVVLSQAGIALGLSHEGSPDDLQFPATDRAADLRQEWDYDGGGRTVATRELSRETADPSGWGWLVLSESRHEYDEAGREIRTLQAKVFNPDEPTMTSDHWAVSRRDLFPSGDVWRQYHAAYDDTVFAETTLDDFDRVVEHVDAAGTKTILAYDSSGHLERSDRLPWDEIAGARLRTYRTSYSYDEVGRTITVKDHGDILAQPQPDVLVTNYSFDGLGRTVREWKANETLSEDGEIVAREFNFLGQTTSTKHGLDLADYDGHSRIDVEYDQLGRAVSRTTNAGSVDGARTEMWSYDGLHRKLSIGHPSRDGTTSRSTTYTYAPNSPHVASVTSPTGVRRTFDYNELGKLVSVLVDMTNAPAHVAGPLAATFRYGQEIEDHSGQAGLRVASLPVVATTYPNAAMSQFSSIVRRGYDARDNTLFEEIQTPGTCGLELIRTEFEYDDANRRTHVQYPRAEGTYVRRLHDTTDNIVAVQAYAGLGWHTMMRNFYAGDDLTRTDVYEINPNRPEEEHATDLMYSKTYELDGRGRLARATSTHSDGRALLEDELVYSWDGRITSKLQANGDWSHREYDDRGRVRNAVWGSDTSATPDWADVSNSPGIGSGFVHRESSYNDFGELLQFEEYRGDRGAGLTVSFSRDDAGYLSGLAAPNISGEQVLSTYANPVVNYESVRDQAVAVDNAGLVSGTSHSYYRSEECAPGSAYTHNLDLSTVLMSYLYDAWGRRVSETRSVLHLSGSHSCDADRTGVEVESAAVSTLDAYGRTVKYETSGDGEIREVMHAYEYGEIIASIPLDDCGATERGAMRFPNPDRKKKKFAPYKIIIDGPVCGDALVSVHETFTVDRDLEGRPVLSNRDVSPVQGSHIYEESSNFFVREFSPWGVVMQSDYDSHRAAGATWSNSNVPVAAGTGYGDWLAGGEQYPVIPDLVPTLNHPEHPGGGGANVAVIPSQDPDLLLFSSAEENQPTVEELTKKWHELNGKKTKVAEDIRKKKKKQAENPTDEGFQEIQDAIEEWRKIVADMAVIAAQLVSTPEGREKIASVPGMNPANLEREMESDIQRTHPLTTGVVRPDGTIHVETQQEVADSYADNLQLALSAAGLTPAFGLPFDLVNAMISALRGNYVEAGADLFSAIPVVGLFGLGIITRVGKIMARARKAMGAAAEAAQGFDIGQCKDCAQAIMKKLDEAGLADEASIIRVKSPRNIVSNNAAEAGQSMGDIPGIISTNGDHVGVQVGNTVYDNLNPNGIDVDLWVDDLGGLNSPLEFKYVDEVPR